MSYPGCSADRDDPAASYQPPEPECQYSAEDCPGLVGDEDNPTLCRVHRADSIARIARQRRRIHRGRRYVSTRR